MQITLYQIFNALFYRKFLSVKDSRLVVESNILKTFSRERFIQFY